jgi:hypothetical protein
MNAWDSLPNGKHIDTVLKFVRTHPKAARDAARDAAWDAAQSAARDAARDAAWDAAQSAARDAARDAAGDAARDAARDAVRDATVALISWDYAGDLFTADISVVELAAHGGDPAAFLLLPLKRVMESQHEPT